MNASSGDPTAAACRYLLVMLLQRLEAERPGLVAEMRAGVEGDRDAAIGGRDVEGIFEEALRILRLAGGE